MIERMIFRRGAYTDEQWAKIEAAVLAGADLDEILQADPWCEEEFEQVVAGYLIAA